MGQSANFRKTLPVLRIVALLLLGVASASAQDPDPVTGFPPFGSFSNGSFDHIDRANLNVNFSVPITSVHGRGISVPSAIVYDSLMWKEQTTGTVQWTPVLDSANNPTWGWKIDNVLGDIKHGVTNGQTKCPDGSGNLVVTGTVTYSGYVYRDPQGTTHQFLGIHAQQGCNGLTGVYTAFASDHSGLYMDATNLDHPVVYGRNGTKIDTISGLLTDVHGNYIQRQAAPGNPAETDYVDSVGRTSLKIVKLASETDFQFLDINGNYQQVRVLLGTFPIHTAFSCPVTIVEYSGTAQLPTAILLPNGTQYSFSYEPTPGVAGSYTGRVNQVTVPTGAVYQYAYTKPNDSSFCDGTDAEIQKTITSDGVPATWLYSRSGDAIATTESSPDGNSRLFVFGNGVITTQEFACSGSANGTARTCNGQTLRTMVPTFDSNGRPASNTTSLEDGVTKTRQETDYDANDNVIEVREFDWFTGATPSVPTRTTHITYSTDPTYTPRNLLSLVTRRTVYQGSSATGAPIARTDITYDEPAYFDATCPAGIVHHDDSLPCSIVGHGLPTTTTNYSDAVTPGGGIPQHVTYDWFGNPVKADLNGVVQSQSTFSNTTAFALPDRVTAFPNAASPLATNFTYNSYTGAAQTITDPNGQVTTLSYDQFGRLIDTKRPDNAHIINTFDDINRKFTSKTPIQGTDTAISSTLYDGLGRPFRQTLTDAAGNTYSNLDTQYDSMGRIKQTSNPYLGTPQYWTQTVYDALGRVTQTIPPDGTVTANYIGASYSVNITTITDQTGRQTRQYADAFGRLTRVDEPALAGVPAGTAQGSVSIVGNTDKSVTNGGAPATSGTGSVTFSGVEEIICGIRCTPDTGTVTVTVNGKAYGGTTQGASTPATIASNMKSTIQADGARLVNASCDLTGGHDLIPGTTVYDTGQVTVTLHGLAKTVNYGQSDTNISIAAGIANAFNNDPSSLVTAGTGGTSTVTFVATSAGSGNNFSLSATSVDTQTTYFSSPSFTTNTSGANLTGGQTPVAAIDNNPAITLYNYDGLNNLTRVEQHGYSLPSSQWRIRTYSYDALSRLTSSTLPEAGLVQRQFNSLGQLSQVTDARGVITTYGYDDQSRLHQISYTVGTTGVPSSPTITYTYGTNATQNNNGRLLTETDGLGSETYSYDIMGRVTNCARIINGIQYNTGYGYNLDGEMISTTYPSGRVVQQGYDAVGRSNSVSDVLGSVATTHATQFGYNPAGQITSFNYGNGVAANFGYSPDRQQLTSLSYVKGAQTLFGLNYSFNQSGANNGQIAQINDLVDAGRTLTLGYDTLHRIATAQTAGSASYPQWGLGWNYDEFGNRRSQNVTAGSAGSNSLNFAATATNRVDTWSYDASGNVLNDGLNTYVFDAAGNLISANATAAQYAYDAKGLRGTKTAAGVSTTYIYSGGKPIAEYTGGTSLAKEYVYRGNLLMATYEAGTLKYHHGDSLSDRLITSSTGAVLGQQGHFPFGETWYAPGGTTTIFTNYIRDSETDNDYAFARYYAARNGRFGAPDLVSGDSQNPQSWNRYAYVQNNPINLVDPLGLLEMCSGVEGGPGEVGSLTGCEPIEFALPNLPGDGKENAGGSKGSAFVTKGCTPHSKLPAIARKIEDALYAALFLAAIEDLFHGTETNTVGVGVGVSGGAGFGFSEDLSIGTGTSVSGLYAMDQSGQPAILINTPSLNFPAILTNKPGWTIGIAVQAGAQLFMSPKYVPGLGGPSAGVSGSSGPVAIDVNTNGASVTLGAGAGSRAGVSGAVSPTFVFLVCKD